MAQKPQTIKAVVSTGEQNGAAEFDRFGGDLRYVFDEESGQYDVYVYGKCKRVCKTSLMIFSIEQKPRQLVIRIVENVWFDRFILFLIIINSIFLSMTNYRNPEKIENKIVKGADPFLLTFFTLECFFKCICVGFVLDKNSYLRDGWNWLVFIVVVTGLVSEMEAGSSNLSFLRVFRVLRPLRSLTVLPEMRVLVNTVLQSIPRLIDVMNMALFLFLIFGIMGINFWGGVMFRQCRATPNPVLMTNSSIMEGAPCWSWPVAQGSLGDGDRLCGGRYMCHDTEYQRCGSIYTEDPDAGFRPSFDGSDDMRGYPWCLDEGVIYAGEYAKIDAYNFRITHFDHLPAALLVIFQCTTLEGWTDIMYMIEDSYSPWFADFYFSVLIFVTSFFLLNVALAVIWEAFSELSEQAEAEEEEQKLADGVEAEDEEREIDDVLEVFEGLDEEDWEEQPPWKDIAIVHTCRKIAFNEVFVSVVMFFITANVITMMLDKYPPPDRYERLGLYYCNLIFNSVFTVEFLINIGAMGPWRYWTSPVTAFDGFIVLVSLAELFMGGGGGGAVKAFRGFRLLRIFRLAKKWTSFRVLLKSILETVMSMGNFTVLLILCMYVFTLMAMQFFAKSFKFDGDNAHIPDLANDGYCGPDKDNGREPVQDLSCVPRSHFDTFLWAFVTIFQILSGENWNATMYDGMKAGGFGAVFFFLALIIVGQCIILNLFLAILMAKFEEASNDIREKEEASKQSSQRKSKAQTALATWSQKMGGPGDLDFLHTSPNTPFGLPEIVKDEQSNDPNMVTLKDAADASRDAPKPPSSPLPPPEVLPGQVDDLDLGATGPQKLSNGKEPEDLLRMTPHKPVVIEKPMPTPEKPEDAAVIVNDVEEEHEDYAFLVLDRKHPLRDFCIRGMNNKAFDNVILACICISSLCMAIDRPLDNPADPLPTFLRVLGVFFVCIFTIEMLMKMVAMGFILGKGAYFRVAWNILDGVVVIVSLIDLFAANSGLRSLRTLRILRALRPLRVISRNENLKLVVNTLFKSIPELCNLLIVGVLFFLIFALFGVSNFKGNFYMCSLGDGAPAFPDYDYGNIEFIKNSTNGMLYTPWGRGEDDPAPPGEKYKIRAVPMCYNDRGEGSPMGEYSGETERFMVTDEMQCQGIVHWRHTADTPICVARCNPSHDPNIPRPDVKMADGSLRCPPPPDKIEQLPSVCPDAELDADEQIGQAYYDKMIMWDVMTCGGNGDDIKGCRDVFCPDVSQEDINRCADECVDHPMYCSETCTEDVDSVACKLCQEQCQAQCQCSEFCGGYIEDAALCVEHGGTWVPTLNNDFDSILHAMLTLFEISTTEGWVDVMYSGADARGFHKEPVRDAQQIWSLFFVAFIFIGSFFILNLCVGVIVDNFNSIKKTGDEILLTDAQKAWIEAQKSFLKRKYFFGLTDLHKQPVMRRKIYFFVSTSSFDNFIMSCIILNTVTMGMKIFPSPSPEYKDALKACNYIFAFVFTSECVLKLYALQGNYFKDAWNKFDFLCVVASLVSLVIDLATTLEIGSVMSAIRLFRIARLFRVVKFMKGLNRLFTAFLLSIPKLLNVAILLLLLLLLFAVLGVQLFHKTKFWETHTIHGNFREFFRGFMTLVRSMTGEAWNEIMHDLSKNEQWWFHIAGEACYEQGAMYDVTLDSYDTLYNKCLLGGEFGRPQGCGSIMAYFFFIAYTCVISFVILNLVIAVILEGFEDSNSEEESDIVGTCVDIWRKYDTDCCMILPLKDVFRFIEEVAMLQETESKFPLSMPLQLPTAQKTEDKIDFSGIPMRIANCCNMKLDAEQHMHFLDAVKLAIRVILSCNSPDQLREIKQSEEDPKLQKDFTQWESEQKKRQKYDHFEDQPGAIDLPAEVASTKIQVLFKGRQARKKVNQLKEEKGKRHKIEDKDFGAIEPQPPKAG
jgi:hypothetical protein